MKYVGLDPKGMVNSVNAYFFLSDGAQDEISGSDGKKMKCLSCGHRFKGEATTVAQSFSARRPTKLLMKKTMDIGDSS